MKILMVCLGNICRSPLAEGILQQKIIGHNLPWSVDSAGTGDWHIGQAPDPRSVAVARRYGIDITAQRARQIKAVDLDRFDLILAMDESNYRDILRLATSPGQEKKVRLIMDYAQAGAARSVPDPYWNDDGFERVFHMLDQACDRLIDHYRMQV